MIPVGILTAAATSSFSFLLDVYPTAYGAYSLRKLRAGYTGSAIRVRRSSDNTELDIGFVNNVLDTTTLLTFCGSSSGYVSKVYTQQGHVDMVQAVLVAQPLIVNAGVLQTLGTKACLVYDGTTSFMNGVGNYTGSNLSIFNVCKINDNYFTVNFGGNSNFLMFGFTSTFPADAITLLSRYRNNVITSTADATQVTAVFGNNTYFVSSSYYGSTGFPGLGFFNQEGIKVTGSWQESIFYQTNQVSNNTGIMTNINTYYSIY
jgi:hypothetical protein